MLRACGFDHIYIVTGLVALTLAISTDSQALSQNGTLKQSRAPKSVRSSRYKLPKNISKINSSFSGNVSASYSQNLVDQKDGSNFYSGSLMTSFGYKVVDSWSVGSSIGYSQDLKDAETSSNGVTDLGLSLKLLGLSDLKYFSQTVGFNTVVPVSKESREIDNLTTSFGARYSLSSLAHWLIPGFSFCLSISANKNFHSFETNKGGRILTSYSVREATGVSYEINKFSLSADISHSHRFNYENRVSEGISHSQDIGYEIIPDQWSATIGHSNEGPWFKENGEDLNLEAVSDDNSVFYMQTSVSF